MQEINIYELIKTVEVKPSNVYICNCCGRLTGGDYIETDEGKIMCKNCEEEYYV
jgi:formylmethanofuran dehydrogenase subunit E